MAEWYARSRSSREGAIPPLVFVGEGDDRLIPDSPDFIDLGYLPELEKLQKNFRTKVESKDAEPLAMALCRAPPGSLERGSPGRHVGQKRVLPRPRTYVSGTES